MKNKQIKKGLKYILLSVLIVIIYLGYTMYPKLDIISGFSSKSITSHLFIGGRSMDYTITEDNNIPSMHMSNSTVDHKTKTVSSSTYGLKLRKTLFRKGLGSVLLPPSIDKETMSTEIPKRIRRQKTLPYPYGSLIQKDTIFDNVDYKKLKTHISSIFEDTPTTNKKTRSVLVVYKDKIIGEKYADGFNQKSILLGWSMAKSVLSAVLGVLEKKNIISLNQDHIFKEWNDDKRQNITLRNLINMNSGLGWEEDYTKISDVTKMLFLATDMSKPQIAKSLSGEPDNSWTYSSGTSNLLSGFIRNQFDNQQAYLDFWYQELIDKIGMNSMLMETDYSGHFVGSSYVWANTRDWAKFGLLYLHEGNWNGEQIIDTSWINFTKEPTNGSQGTYGGHFWLNAGKNYPDLPRDKYFPDVPDDMYYSDGFQGKFVFIIPSKNLVVVRMGLHEDPDFDINAFLGGICSTIRN